MSRREELAFFAVNRGNCLMDNFDFVSAVEAYHWARQLAPKKQSINDTMGLAIYSAQIWQWMMKLPDQEKDMPLPLALKQAANQLDGPSVETYRKEAVKNVLRIIQNRRRRDYARRHADIVQQEFPELPRSPDDV